MGSTVCFVSVFLMASSSDASSDMAAEILRVVRGESVGGMTD
jgi:hypothetical protein